MRLPLRNWRIANVGLPGHGVMVYFDPGSEHIRLYAGVDMEDAVEYIDRGVSVSANEDVDVDDNPVQMSFLPSVGLSPEEVDHGSR